ncbi:hypothetical protein C0989_003610 [Termitomyces sp. Mn162]|nr:hypothetical protein C0989_003610 [Termitomyces sp. Mn162]
MLVDSSATNNFIHRSLAVLAPHHLLYLPTLIVLKLFDGDPTSAGNITHCMEMTVTFTNGQCQDLWLLVTKLHLSAPINLGFSWLHSTSPHIDWSSLTLCLDQNSLTDSGPVPFDVSLPSKHPEGMTNASWTLLQLCSKSTWSFIINIWLDGSLIVLPALVNSSTCGTFISNQLDFHHNNLDKPLKLQLFDRSPTSTGITQYHNNALILDNNSRFQVWLLVTQLSP